MRLALISAAVCLAAGPALADTKVEYLDEGSKQPVNVLYVTGDKMRMENVGSSGTYMIFDATAKTVTTVDPKKKKVTVMDEATIAEMGAKMADARKQMDAAMANMSPEQKAQMEKMMGAHMGAGAGASKPKPVYTRTGKRSKAAGYDCEIVSYEVAGQKGEMCVAASGALELPASDVNTLKQFGAFMEKMTSQVMPGMSGDTMNISALGGLPVRSQQAGKPAQVLREVSHAALPASLFAVPSDYTRQSLMPKGR